MNYSQVQEKGTYHPQGKVKGGHAHEERRNRFKVDIYVWEMHVELFRLGMKKKSVGQDVEVRVSDWMRCAKRQRLETVKKLRGRCEKR
jgi:hypothetical protein